MALIAVSVVTATTQMGVTLSLGTAAALQAGQVKSAIPFVNLGGLFILGFGGSCWLVLLCYCINYSPGLVTANF